MVRIISIAICFAGGHTKLVPLIEKNKQIAVYQYIKLIFITYSVVSTLWKPIILIGALSKWLMRIWGYAEALEA